MRDRLIIWQLLMERECTNILLLILFNLTFRGEWNAAFISTAYLVKYNKLQSVIEKKAYSHNELVDPDMSLCQYWRENVRTII